MDFSTLEKRRAACENEIAINRQSAPELYLGVVPITKDASGLHLGGPGDVVEWAVHLRRFDEEATLDRMVARGGRLDSELIAVLAQRVEAMHRRASVSRDSATATRALRAAMDETMSELRQSPEFVAPALATELAQSVTRDFDRLEPLLLSRGDHRHVRRCHGDLHLRNIVLIDKEPVIFDALEFDDALATTDTLYDLAFLLMDLCRHGLTTEANQLLNHYLWRCADEKSEIEGLAGLPLFLALRALIRAKVTITQMRLLPQGAVRAPVQSEINSYLYAARAFLDPAPARIIAIGGLSGTGKTTLAAAIAPEIGAPPGALHLRSDIERKRLFGIDPSTHLGREGYDASVTSRVYRTLTDYAASAVGSGRSVIVDATFRLPQEREAIAEAAERHPVPFIGIWLEAPREVLLARVAARQRDASDATQLVVTAQLGEVPGQISWTRLDAGQSIEKLKAAVLQLIARHHTS
ncbi:MAG TPA: AAA family ATPase, partial [Alphaproteobacteria bacterium]|nr:AAA family ATPase [Alphaproteobacteria bacterium]